MDDNKSAYPLKKVQILVGVLFLYDLMLKVINFLLNNA